MKNITKNINTFEEYMADETRVTPEESRKIKFEMELIGKLIKAREKRRECESISVNKVSCYKFMSGSGENS